MDHGFSNNPTLTVAIALAAGMIAQVLARHAGAPGIVVLLVVGVALGPEGLSLVEPASLGPALMAVVNFAVAIILFEGALNLNLSRIRQQSGAIRGLLTVGALCTTAAGILIGRYVLGWDWSLATLLGCLVMVTGPTVINPLLRRVRVDRAVSTVLEAEGVFIDAIGAVVAVVAMEVVIQRAEVAAGPLHFVSRLGAGALMGLLGGAAIATVFRFRSLVPDGLKNVLTLALALALFQTANAAVPESGVAAVVAAGMVVGNLSPELWRELHEFKEQLTVMLIGLLFVLLAADVRLAQIQDLGLRGAIAVALLILVARPLAVAISTWRTDLTWRQKLFIGWIGPRGIVAAAIASLFAVRLENHGFSGGRELQAMVFLVIAATVIVSSSSARFVARHLGIDRPMDRGWLILGANTLALAVGRAVRAAKEDVVFIDSNPDACRAAESEGFRVIYGNGLTETSLAFAGVDERSCAIGLTQNDETNFLFSEKVHELTKAPTTYVSLESLDSGVTDDMVRSTGAQVLFGRDHDRERWGQRLSRDEAHLEAWRFHRSDRRDGNDGANESDAEAEKGLLLPLLFERRGVVRPVSAHSDIEKGDTTTFIVHSPRQEEAHARLEGRGWVRAEHTTSSNADE